MDLLKEGKEFRVCVEIKKVPPEEEFEIMKGSGFGPDMLFEAIWFDSTQIVRCTDDYIEIIRSDLDATTFLIPKERVLEVELV